MRGSWSTSQHPLNWSRCVHSRCVSITAIAVISFLPLLLNTHANAANWFDGQEILIECPVWGWEPSPILGVEYEVCFDNTDHCTVAEIGDSVCIPSLGVHDVWITAIEYLSSEPIHYDGDIVRVPAQLAPHPAQGSPTTAAIELDDPGDAREPRDQGGIVLLCHHRESPLGANPMKCLHGSEAVHEISHGGEPDEQHRRHRGTRSCNAKM